MPYATFNNDPEAQGYVYIYEPPYRLPLLEGERVWVVAQAVCGPEARTCIRLEDDRTFRLEQGEDYYFTLEPS